MKLENKQPVNFLEPVLGQVSESLLPASLQKPLPSQTVRIINTDPGRTRTRSWLSLYRLNRTNRAERTRGPGSRAPNVKQGNHRTHKKRRGFYRRVLHAARLDVQSLQILLQLRAQIFGHLRGSHRPGQTGTDRGSKTTTLLR